MVVNGEADSVLVCSLRFRVMVGAESLEVIGVCPDGGTIPSEETRASHPTSADCDRN